MAHRFWLAVAKFAAKRAGNVRVLRVLPEPTDEEWARYADSFKITSTTTTWDGV
jgi:hypothetical protein